ncbi:helix-turn-helix transcriptional regulator [Mucilaginibacter sp. CAU 1740]|uniref:helix-turn-helix domain-containing protein n=1 Tax=Mucilaginibacter sp. CAU 1740 TaxID=3140365 RepID=UPI00325BB3F3
MNHIVIREKISLVLHNIRSVRHFRNFTQEYLAVQMGISPKTYSKIENGVITLTVEYLLQIAEILNIELSQLIGNESISAVSVLT